MQPSAAPRTVAAVSRDSLGVPTIWFQLKFRSVRVVAVSWRPRPFQSDQTTAFLSWQFVVHSRFLIWLANEQMFIAKVSTPLLFPGSSRYGFAVPRKLSVAWIKRIGFCSRLLSLHPNRFRNSTVALKMDVSNLIENSGAFLKLCGTQHYGTLPRCPGFLVWQFHCALDVSCLIRYFIPVSLHTFSTCLRCLQFDQRQ